MYLDKKYCIVPVYGHGGCFLLNNNRNSRKLLRLALAETER